MAENTVKQTQTAPSHNEDTAKVVQVEQPIESLGNQVSFVLHQLDKLSDPNQTEINGLQLDGFKKYTYTPNESNFPALDGLSILNAIQELFLVEESSDEEDGGRSLAVLPKLDETSKLALTSYSFAAYCKFLNTDHSSKISAEVHIDTVNLLNALFRTNYSGAFFNHNSLEGIVKLFQLLLASKYPHYNEEGYEAVRNKYPVIYAAHDASIYVAQYICKQLSLPLYCIRKIPSDPATPYLHRIDPVELETNIREDSAAGKLPFFVLAEVGSVLNGHVDDLGSLYEICTKYGMWLHARGNNLSGLCLNSYSDNAARPAHSITLSLNCWLKSPALPTVTLFCDINNDRNLSETLSLQYNEKLITLPVWSTLKNFGQRNITDHMFKCFSVIEIIRKKLVKYDCLRILSPSTTPGDLSVTDVLMKNFPLQTILETVQTCIVFQFTPTKFGGGPVPNYYDKLNSWLSQIIQRDIPSINLNLSEFSGYGMVIRLCPFENLSVNPEEYDSFLMCLEQQVEILRATVEHKDQFVQLVNNSNKLKLVEMPGWAGLGGVRYIPQAWESLETDQAKDELNRLNIQVVNQLRNTDAAFSLGEAADGLACVRFGMVTAETDVGELLSLVEETGQQEEEAWKFIDTMAEVVRKGIEAATLDLQKENEEKLWQEGLLRHVPVFGSFVNWWSPVDKDPTKLKGRTLDLTAGVVETTENIYRYHAQGTPTTTPTPQLTPQLTPPISESTKPRLPTPPPEVVPEEQTLTTVAESQ